MHALALRCVWDVHEALPDVPLVGVGGDHLGGATLDNEENYLIRKLFTLGLGMVCISNQARI